ncbi:hypothetical protein [Citricoccus muralis]|uniref:Uncharacterized protein n=1 Tax=Citricoccus muralis TaxID=169134 RepID=A0ABY8H8P3_9MICC|nr:hypothetical protein [Citricoccus muralis]WFP17527.1 hypothetical protein P8192_05315 [Citricoccus muralis]
MTGLETALLRLLEKRDALQIARGPFGPVSIYYPEAHPTRQQQKALHATTVEFFDTYYAAVAALSTVVKRYRSTFGDSPSNSVSRFLKWWKSKGLFMDEAYGVLESARAFRAMFAHAESRPPYDWHTAVDGNLTKLVLIGESRKSGVLPEGASSFDGEQQWSFLAPDEDLVVSAISVQLNALIPELGAGQDIQSALECTWTSQDSDQDVTLNYPMFAHRDSVVDELYETRSTIHTEVVRLRTDEDDAQTRN